MKLLKEQEKGKEGGTKELGRYQVLEFERITTFQTVVAVIMFIQLLDLTLLDLKVAYIFQH